MTESSQELMKFMNPNSINTKKSTLGHTVMRLQNARDKGQTRSKATAVRPADSNNGAQHPME